jgi:hypothetical protein
MSLQQTQAARGEAVGTSHCYCPTELLARLALLMAAHGRCVNTDMMLGDREYAMWQLATARALDDEELASVTNRLFDYFDDTQHTGVTVTGTA